MGGLDLTALAVRVVFSDPLGAKVAAGAAGVLAAVLIWHFVSMVRQGRWNHWTCWSAGVIASITAVWLIALVTSDAFDNVWTKLVLLAMLAVATVIIFYHSVYHYLGPSRVSVLLVLRCLAIAVLVLLLFKPALGRGPGQSDRPLLVVLVDRSQSMNEADGPDGRQRLTAAVDAVLAEQTKTETYFDVRYFVFDQAAVPVERAGKLADEKPAGSATYLDTALATVGPLLADERAEGVVLISDGIHNGPGSAVAATDALPRPLFAVGVGGPVPEGRAGRDVAISRVTAPDQAFSHDVTRVEVDVESHGYAGKAGTAILRQVGGEELTRADVKLADGVVGVKLEFAPRQIGVMELEVELTPLSGEAVAANNRHQFATRVGEPQIKVLYVEGSIRSEFRFLTDELMGDQHVELMTLIQIRRLGAGGAGGAQFKVWGSVGGKRLRGMPTTAEQLNLFDVVILGDLDRTYLSDSQMKLLQQAVKDGKGFLMIGGSHSLGPGGYAGTPIEQMLPVALGTRTIGQETLPFKLQLTAAGKVHPVFAGLVEFISPPPDQPASQLPALKGCTKVLGAKTGGQILAVHGARRAPDGRSPLPVLTVQQYGAGRSAAFTADTTWQWRMFRTVAAYEGVYQRFWGQMIRWLASSELVDREQPPAAILNLQRSYYAPGKTVLLTARVWDKDGQAADAARVEVKATGADNKSQVLELAAGEQPGLYQALWTPRGSGAFELAMSAKKAGNLLGTGKRRVEVGRPGAEATRRSANTDLLKRLVARKPGRLSSPYVSVTQYDRLIDQLVARYQRQRLAPEPERTWPRYTNSAYGLTMLVFIGLLSFEWLLRRRWQLH